MLIAFWTLIVVGNTLLALTVSATGLAFVERAIAAGVGLVTLREDVPDWIRGIKIVRGGALRYVPMKCPSLALTYEISSVLDFALVFSMIWGIVVTYFIVTRGATIVGYGVIVWVSYGILAVPVVLGFGRIGGFGSPERMLGWSKEQSMSNELESRGDTSRVLPWRQLSDGPTNSRPADRSHGADDRSSSAFSGTTMQDSRYTDASNRARQEAFLFLDVAKLLRKVLFRTYLPIFVFTLLRFFYSPYIITEGKAAESAYSEPVWYALIVGGEFIALTLMSWPRDSFAFMELPRLAEDSAPAVYG
ncbi:hypothetical protein HDU93_008831 [Gonapodya sp. JEL0774]|nr:hypothetical protein HDU93_008831 [Gonapodya sp. JEL0774]